MLFYVDLLGGLVPWIGSNWRIRIARTAMVADNDVLFDAGEAEEAGRN